MAQHNDHTIEALFRSEYDKLYRYALAVTHSPERAEDIVQDTFHEALRKLPTTHENPQGWLMATLKNKIRTSNRTLNRYLLRFLSLEHELAAEDPQLTAVIEEGTKESVSDILVKLRQVLTEEEFHLLKRLIFDKASHREVAQELSVSVWACQKRLERIRKKLEEEFPEHAKKRTAKICQLLLLLAIYR